MSLNANDKKIFEILRDSRRVFVIPPYQRSYSWEAENLREFWDDLKLFAFERREQMFIGSVILCPSDENVLPDVKAEAKYFDVIDGQQRLTTLMILLRAIYDTAIQSGVEERWVKEKIFNKYLFVEKPQEYRLRLSKADNDFFRQNVFDIDSVRMPKGKFKSHKNIVNSLKFFREVVAEFVAEREGDVKETLDSLLDRIGDSLVFVSIEAESDVDAYTIFETINAKKRDLTPSELIKNYLFSVASKERKAYADVSQKWEQISDQLSSSDIDVTAFIRHYWISSHEGKVSEKRLYRTLREETDRELSKVKHLVQRLSEEVHNYSYIASPSGRDGGMLSQSISQLNELNLKQCYPLLLSLLATYSDDLNQINKVAKKIIGLTVRRGFADLNPNEMEKLYSDYAQKIRSKEAGVEELLEALNQRDVKLSNFVADVQENDASQKISKFILSRLAEDLMTGDSLLSSEIDVEHIMPQNPKAYQSWGCDEKVHAETVELIGNKTILYKRLNQIATNDPYEKKIESYKKSDLKLTQEVAKKYKTWSVETIKQRSKKIAEEFSALY